MNQPHPPAAERVVPTSTSADAPLSRTLKLELLSYWRSGTGQSQGYQLDAISAKDGDDLPYLPGKQLRGQLRQAVALAQHWGWFDEMDQPLHELSRSNPPSAVTPPASWTDYLFGSHQPEMLSRYDTEPGRLHVSSAVLPSAEQAWLRQTQHSALLYRTLATTALDNHTGSVREHSLRQQQVVVPVTLFAELSLCQRVSPLLRTACYQIIHTALPLLREVGADRRRGAGRVRCTLLSANGEPNPPLSTPEKPQGAQHG